MRLTRKLFTTVFLFLWLVVASSSQSVRSANVARPAWTPELEKNYGISEQMFHDMGLGDLTLNQYWNFLTWSHGREENLKDSAPKFVFDCNRPGVSLQDTRPEAYDQVRLFVVASGDASEIISGVRERFRAMNGIDVVYNRDESDLVISLVALQTKAKNAGYQLGVAVSVVVFQPCVWKNGTYTHNYDSMQDQFVQVGSDVSGVVDSIVSSIDTDDVESQRALNAQFKTYLRGIGNK